MFGFLRLGCRFLGGRNRLGAILIMALGAILIMAGGGWLMLMDWADLEPTDTTTA